MATTNYKHMITPIEIKQQTFKKGFSGYNKDEVQSFLNTLSVEWERVMDEMKRTKQDLDKTSTQLDGLRQVESALHKTLLQAEETSRHTIESAKSEAEEKINGANANAQHIVQTAMDESKRIVIQIKDLVIRRDEILKQLKGYLVAQTDRLKTFEESEMKEAPEFARLKPKAAPGAGAKPEAKAVPGKKKASPTEEAPKPADKPVAAAVAPAEVAAKETSTPEAPAATPEAKSSIQIKAKEPVAAAKEGIKVVAKDAKEAGTKAVEAKAGAVAAKLPGQPGAEKAKEAEDNSGIKVKLEVRGPAKSPQKEEGGSFFDRSVTAGGDSDMIDDLADEL